MTDRPLGTFTKHRFAPLVNGAVVAIAVVGGGLLTLFVSDFLPGSPPVKFAISIGGVYLFLLASQFRGSDPGIRLFEDHMEFRVGGTPDTVPYEDVQIVVTSTGIGDRLLGSRTYEIVTTTGANRGMQFLADPEEFERILDERILAPHEQYGSSRERSFWQLWPEDRVNHIPERGIVPEGDLASALDVDLADISLAGIDEAAVDADLEDFGDVEAAVESSGDAGAFDDGGSSGGGMDGGDAGGAE